MVGYNRLLLIGGGGHCKSVLDCLLQQNLYTEYGIVDFDPSASLGSILVVGNDDDLPRLYDEGWKDAFITVGSIGDNSIRHRLYETLKSYQFNIPIIADASAVIAEDAIIGEGVFVGKGAIVNAGVRIGDCAIVNTGSIIEHDCVIGELSHISTGSILCGQVVVGKDTHVGAGSVVRQCIKIGDNTIVGVGSVVVKDIPSNVEAYGNPCRVI